jgi:hypothetical protein
MKNKFVPNKVFEQWIDNPYMLHKDNDPSSFCEYTHPYTKGAWDCYKYFVLKTKVVSTTEHEEEVVKMIADFLQQELAMRTKERNDLNAKVISLKQASIGRLMAAAREAIANGTLRSLSGTKSRSQTRELRVKSA